MSNSKFTYKGSTKFTFDSLVNETPKYKFKFEEAAPQENSTGSLDLPSGVELANDYRSLNAVGAIFGEPNLGDDIADFTMSIFDPESYEEFFDLVAFDDEGSQEQSNFKLAASRKSSRPRIIETINNKAEYLMVYESTEDRDEALRVLDESNMYDCLFACPYESLAYDNNKRNQRVIEKTIRVLIDKSIMESIESPEAYMDELTGISCVKAILK